MKTTLNSNSSVSVVETEERSQAASVNTRAQASGLFRKLGGTWGNLSLQTKLVILLAAATVIPVFTVTQQLNKLSADSFLANLKESLNIEATVLSEEYVLRSNKTAKTEAENIALSIQSNGVDLSQVKEKELIDRRNQLQQLLSLSSDAPVNEVMSFKIITDTEGKTIAQNVQILDGDLASNPLLPPKDGALPKQQYRNVPLASGVVLGDVPIVKSVLQTKQPLSGIELFQSATLERLGLSPQAGKELRPQVIKGLPAPKQPFPTGTYDIDGGKAGFVSISVYPINVNGRLVGTVIVGSLLNRNNGLIDDFVQKYAPESVATIFAKDLRVATNVPYINPDTKARDNTRATSTLLSREVAEVVLNQGQIFKGETNIAGLDYQTVYLPLYDHQKQLNPQAKPVGMTLVGKPLAKVNDELRNQQLLGYGIGGSILLLSAFAAVLIAATLSRPLQRLSNSARRIKEGEQGIKIEVSDRQDEIGQLSSSLASLLDQLSINEELRRQELVTSESLKQAASTQKESEVLQTDVGHILDVVLAVEDGDLTVQADVNDRATGLVSDTLNRLVEQLGQVLSQVLGAAKQVSSRSSRLEESAKTVANNALAQAKEVSQVLKLIEEVEEAAQSSTGKVNQSNQSLLGMQSTVEQGQHTINTMNQGIGVLQQGTDRIVQQIKTLGEFVGLAEQFVQDQSQIASLTQVLALNATLVAARASEQKDPRKFMAVAREFEAIASQVGNLAQQTNSGLEALQQRTSQINAVVSSVDVEVQGLGNLVNGFTAGVEQTNEVFGNVRSAAGEVIQAGENVTLSNQSIVNATQLTAKTMGDIANLAERTVQLTRGSQIQSERLEGISAQLLKTTQFFRLPASMLQAQETVQRVDLSQAQKDTVAIASFEEDITSLELVSASESV